MKAKRAVTITREMLSRPVVVRTAASWAVSPAELVTSAVAVWLGDTAMPLKAAVVAWLRAHPRLLSELLASREQFKTPPEGKPKAYPRVKAKKPGKQGTLPGFAAEGGPTAKLDHVPGSAESQPKPRPRDLMFDAIVSVCRADPSLKGVGARVKRTQVELQAATSPYTPDDVYEFGRRFTHLCSWAIKDGREYPSPEELVKQIYRIRANKPSADLPPAEPQFGDDKSANERTAYRRLELMWADNSVPADKYPEDWPRGDRWWK